MIKNLFKLWEHLPEEKNIMVLTGNGISVASGLTWEKNNNFWGLNIEEEILNTNVLLNQPEKLWSWVLETRAKLVLKSPNQAHYALVKLEEYFKENFTLISHNIDGLHIKSGSYRIIETHGNVLRNRILDTSKYNEEDINWNFIPRNLNGEYLRPDICLKGEIPERKKMLQAHIIAQQADVVLIIGSKLQEKLIGELPEVAKKYNDAKIIEINPIKKSCEYTDQFIKMKAEEILPILINIIIDLDKGTKTKSKIS